jgi:hypothetical protein
MAQLASRGAVLSTAAQVTAGYQLGGTIGGAAALTTAAGTTAGGTTVIVNVAGSVLTEQRLQQVVQTATLQYNLRNSGNGLSLAGV